MRKAQVFTLGLDSSMVEFGGLDKHLDIKIRYFDEESKRVHDTYSDSISMWKEPAEKQFAGLVKTLEGGGLNIANMVSEVHEGSSVLKTVRDG